MNELFTRVEAARRLGLSPTTLAKAALTGRGPRYIKLGRRVCYTAADLDSWVAACRTSDTADAEARGLGRSLTAGPNVQASAK